MKKSEGVYIAARTSSVQLRSAAMWTGLKASFTSLTLNWSDRH